MSKKIPLFPILSVNFVGTLGYSIIIPFLVYLVTDYGGNAIIYGILGATYPAFQLIGAPILGRWSDVYGRKKILFLSQAGTLLSWFIFLIAMLVPVTVFKQFDSGILGTFSLTLPLIILFLARAFDGLTGGNISVANAYLADVSDEKGRSKNFGKMSISSNLGFIMGPALAGLLGATVLGYFLPVYAAIFISVVATILVAFYLPESMSGIVKKTYKTKEIRKVFGHEERDCIETQTEKSLKLRQVFKMDNIPFVLILYFLVFLGFSIFYTAFPVHAIQSLGWSVTSMGIFFSVLGTTMIIVQGPLLSKLTKKFSDSTLILWGSIILGTNFVLMAFSNETLVYVAAIFFAVGNGIMWPSVLSLISRLAGKKYQGSVQGAASSLASLAGIIGLTTGGILYVQFGGGTFIICAVVIYLTFILSFRLVKLEKKCQTKEEFEAEPEPQPGLLSANA